LVKIIQKVSKLSCQEFKLFRRCIVSLLYIRVNKLLIRNSCFLFLMQEGRLVIGLDVSVDLDYDLLEERIGWSPRFPVRKLRNHLVEKEFRAIANGFLTELQSYDGGSNLLFDSNPDLSPTSYRRVQRDYPPPWYHEMRREIPWFERRRSLGALNRIASNSDESYREWGSESKVIMDYWYSYCLHYRDLIMHMAVEGFEGLGEFVPPNDIARYFTLSLIFLTM